MILKTLFFFRKFRTPSPRLCAWKTQTRFQWNMVRLNDAHHVSIDNPDLSRLRREIPKLPDIQPWNNRIDAQFIFLLPYLCKFILRLACKKRIFLAWKMKTLFIYDNLIWSFLNSKLPCSTGPRNWSWKRIISIFSASLIHYRIVERTEKRLLRTFRHLISLINPRRLLGDRNERQTRRSRRRLKIVKVCRTIQEASAI